jgi:hypothetical protein
MSAVFAWQDRDQSHECILSFCCPRCKFPLTLHQPDPKLSDRILATCDDCKSWYVTDTRGSWMIPVSRLADDLAQQ